MMFVRSFSELVFSVVTCVGIFRAVYFVGDVVMSTNSNDTTVTNDNNHTPTRL